MVLWEITLGTAYFLGLKRTYKLALRIQRKLVSPKYPKIRQFLHRFVFFFVFIDFLITEYVILLSGFLIRLRNDCFVVMFAE